MWLIVMSPVGSVGGQFVVLGWLFSEKGISVRNDDKAPSQRVVCQTVANGTGHKPYTILVTCPYYMGFRVKLVYRPGIGVAYIPCRYLNCVWDRSLDYTGFTDPIFIRLLLLGEAICIAVVRFRICINQSWILLLWKWVFLPGCNRSHDWKWFVTKW